MLEMTNENFARLLRGLTIAVGIEGTVYSCTSSLRQRSGLCTLLDRQVGRPLAFEDAASVDAAQAVCIGYARSVAQRCLRGGGYMGAD